MDIQIRNVNERPVYTQGVLNSTIFFTSGINSGSTVGTPYKYAVRDPEGGTLSFSLLCNPSSSCKRRLLPSLPYFSFDPSTVFDINTETGQLKLTKTSPAKGEGKIYIYREREISQKNTTTNNVSFYYFIYLRTLFNS